MAESYSWDSRSRRFRSTVTGAFLAATAIALALEEYLAASGEGMAQLASQLQSGSLDLAAWEDAMLREIKLTHINAATLAHGGREQMSPADWGFVGVLIRAQYVFLRGWAADLAAGSAPVDGRLVARARLYAQSANATYAAMRARDMRNAGLRFERNVLTPGENCAGCVVESARQWVEIGELIPVGHRHPCLVNCRCVIQYSNSRSVEEAA